MVTRVLTVSILAGLLAGLIVAALQHVTTTPLILKAETYEAALALKAPTLAAFDGEAKIILAHGPAGDAPGHDHAEWKPQDGFQRTLFTSAVTIATAIGFAGLLLAGMIAAGDTIDQRNALVWGACGFLALGLAPAMGLVMVIVLCGRPLRSTEAIRLQTSTRLNGPSTSTKRWSSPSDSSIFLSLPRWPSTSWLMRCNSASENPGASTLSRM